MPTPRSKLIKPSESGGCTPVDPRTLGRPFHLLTGFATHVRTNFADYFERRFNRRYGAAVSVATADVCHPGDMVASGKWHHFRSGTGQISYALDRGFLLALLDYRYGGKEAATQCDPVDDSAPETETELRLSSMLGLDLLDVLVNSIQVSGSDSSGASGFRLDQGGRLANAIGFRIDLEEAGRGAAGSLWFAMDDAWQGQLLASVASSRPRQVEKSSNPVPLANQLQITLTTQLLSMEMTLGEVLDIRPGDVIPVSIGQADVLVDDSCLFNASVAEHNGKLWLTSFEDLE